MAGSFVAAAVLVTTRLEKHFLPNTALFARNRLVNGLELYQSEEIKMQSEINAAEKRLNDLNQCIFELEEEIRLCDQNAIDVLESASETINRKRIEVEAMIDEMRDNLTASHQCDVILSLKYKEDAIATTISTLEQAEDLRIQNELQELDAYYRNCKIEQYKKYEAEFLNDHSDVVQKTVDECEVLNKKTLDGLLKVHQMKLKELSDS